MTPEERLRELGLEIPDPPPEWASELLTSLRTAEALSDRLEATARLITKPSAKEVASV